MTQTAERSPAEAITLLGLKLPDLAGFSVQYPFSRNGQISYHAETPPCQDLT